MKQITLNIPDSKFEAFMRIIKASSFVKTASKKNVSVKNRKFTVLKTENKNYKFDREELNER
jgi:hypothetical protein